MVHDPFPGWGLRPVELADRDLLTSYFASLHEPLSDYTFSQLFTWRNSLRILWKQVRGHLCVFANGTGDLTLLLPPIGDTGGDGALAEAFELMNEYNASAGVPDRSRVEYVSDELLGRFDRSRVSARPMGADYVYDVRRMIELAGGDLASKRQAKNRFIRNYPHRVEPYRAADHRDGCLALLDTWKIHQDAQHLEESDASSIKRSKESIATALCLDTAEALGMKGMVVYVERFAEGSAEGSGFRVQTSASSVEPGSGNPESPTSPQREPRPLNPEPRTPNPLLRAFTFGEYLGRDQSSITIEKTDLATKGLAQFIFSEFCRQCWGDRPFVNVGDDWGLESLAWTKQSYRPVKLLRKYVLRPVPVASSGSSGSAERAAEAAAIEAFPEVVIRAARKDDLPAAAEMERSSFTAFAMNKRQLQYHQQRGSSIFLVAEQGGRVVGDGIALIRTHKTGVSGRIYSLVVRTDCRGQKIGGRLLSALLDALSARGVGRVYLEVEQGNETALRLYDRFGFRGIGTLDDYYAPGRHAIHMMFQTAAGCAPRPPVLAP